MASNLSKALIYISTILFLSGCSNKNNDEIGDKIRSREIPNCYDIKSLLDRSVGSIGISLAKKEDGYFVSVLDYYSAAKRSQKVLVGDKILAVSARRTENKFKYIEKLTLPDAECLFYEKIGETVTVKLEREGKQYIVPILLYDYPNNRKFN